MTCANSANVSFRFNTLNGDTYLEIRPKSMQYDQTRGKLDYCKAEFGQDVADVIKREINKGTLSPLTQPLSVILRIKGENLYRLLWVPDGARFVEDGVHVEFHDPQKFLTKGVIDWKQESVRIKDAYEYVFENRSQEGPQVLNDIKFSIAENSYNVLRANDESTFSPYSSTATGYADYDNYVKDAEQENIVNIINDNYAVDFDKMTPWECINELNEKFAVTTWVDSEGNLWVGSRSATGYPHIAASDDDRVWKITEYNTPAPRDPVVRSVIRGGWENDNDESWYENAEELISQRRTQDFRIEGVAKTKTSSLLGQEIFIEDINAKKDSLEDIAKLRLSQKQREQQNGYIDINPEISGVEFSDPKYVKIGDTLRTVPPDNDLNNGSVCDTNIEDELFHIVGIQHELSEDGNWRLRLDVVKQLDDELNPDNIETNLRYYDPFAEEYIDGDAYSTLQAQEGSFFDGLFD